MASPGSSSSTPKTHSIARASSSFGIIGDAQHCAERLGQIAGLGLANIYIGTRSVGVDLEERNTLRIGREVLPLVRALC